MQNENVFKVIGVVHVILAFLKLLLLLKVLRRWWLLRVLELLEGSTSTHDRNAKTSPAHTHTCKQEQTLRNSTTIHKNSKQN